MVVLIAGKKGSGKTTLLKNIVSKQKSYINLDYLGELEGIEIEDIKELESKINEKINYFGDAEDLFYELISYEGFTLIIDECHLYLNSYTKKSSLFTLIRLSRHLNANIILVTQRIKDIPSLIVSQADYLILFNHSEPKDLNYLSNYIADIEIIKNLSNYKYIVLSP